MRHRVPRRRIFTLVLGTVALCATFFVVQFSQFEAAQDLWAAIRRRTVKAALTGVTINNGNSNLATGNDLTSQTTALSPDLAAYRWTVDGGNLMALNVPFNSGVSQTDLSGNASSGTMNGATFTTAGCQVGSCMSFDGNDNVAFPDSASLDALTGNMSISVWVKPGAVQNAYATILSKHSNGGFSIEQNAGATNQYYFTWDANGGGAFQCVGGAVTALTADVWQNFVIVKSGGTVTNYLNGVSGASCGGSSTIVANNLMLKFGQWSANDTRYWSGVMDEVQIFPRALTADEVTQLYTNGNAGLGGPSLIKSAGITAGQFWHLTITPISTSGTIGTAVNSSNSVFITSGASGITGSLNATNEVQDLTASLSIPGGSIAAYRWNKNSQPIMVLNMPFNTGSTQSDLSGSGNNGSTVNGAAFTASGCKVGGCLSFDGVDDYVTVPHAVNLHPTGSATFEFWGKFNVLPAAYREVFQKSIALAGGEYYARTTSASGIEFWFENANRGYYQNPSYATLGLSTGNWYHIVFTIDDTAQIAYVYVNGALKSSAATAYAGSAPAAGALTLGGSTYDGVSNMVMDEFKIYPRALSIQQILQNYADGLGSSQNATNGVGGSSLIKPQEHVFGEIWDLITTELYASGDVGFSTYIGQTTISAAPATTLNVTTPSGTQSEQVTISYTCSASDNTTRDLLVQYSTNSGGVYANASPDSTSSGTISGSIIQNATCNGSAQTFVWDSVSDGVASGTTTNAVRIRLTAQIGAAPTGETADFAVTNGTINVFSSPTSIASGNTTYDSSNIICNGTTLTIDGAHTFQMMRLKSGCVLQHSPTTTSIVNSLNLTITTNLIVESGASVNVNARGYLAGGNGGSGSLCGYTSGNTLYACGGGANKDGASHAGLGGDGIGGSGIPPAYGSVTNPTEPGGGGGAFEFANSTQGGVGGGLIRMTVGGTLTNNGSITANSGAAVNMGAGGAGGGVYLNVGTLAGSGFISANGGASATNCFAGDGGGGGGGRIAVLYTTSTFTGTMSASGGAGSCTTTPHGGAGTIYTKSAVQSFGNLIADNGSQTVPEASTPLPAAPTAFDNITISNGARVSTTATLTEIANALTITSGWLTLGTTAQIPITSVSLSTAAVLTHAQSTTTTVYKIDLNVSGSITVDATSSLHGNGRGYVGGGNGGSGTLCGYTSGNTEYACGGAANKDGGSHGGIGGDGLAGVGIPPAYGSLTNPVEPGGGGGAYEFINSTAGGRGGGLVRLTVAGTLTNNGTIAANAGTGVNMGAGGAGGGIYINTPTLTGSGTITANGSVSGGNCFAGDAGGGGGGRIALLFTTNSLAGAITADGGAGSCTTTPHGGAGTIYLKSASQTYGDLIVKNNNLVPVEASTPLPATPTIFDSITLSNAARVSSSSLSQVVGVFSLNNAWFTQGNPAQIQLSSLSLASSSIFTHSATTTTTVHKVNLTVSGSMTIDGTSTMHGNGRGYVSGGVGGSGSLCGYTSGNTLFGCGGSANKDGASYGGHGGNGVGGGAIPPAYGSITDPNEPGGGGGAYEFVNSTQGGVGGGLIRLIVGGTLTNSGTISANSGASVNMGAGGAGGGVYIDVGTFAGAGAINANGGAPGGNCFAGDGGGGGGGRIAVYYNASTFSGSTTAYPGAGSCTTTPHGAGGTVFIKDNALSNGDLTVSNNNLNAVSGTHTALYVTGQPSTYTFKDLSVLNQAELVIDTPCLGTPALTVIGVTTLSGSGVITNNQSGTCTVSQPAINVTTTSLPAGVVGVAYNQTIQSAGGYGPHTFVCRNGGVTVACSTVLPSGLSMSSAGVLSGTPTTTGVYPFTVRATEASPGVGTDDQSLSISVGNAPTAPTTLFVHNTNAQLGNTTPSGIDGSPVFSAIFNDPDTGETATKYRVQVASDAGFTTILWESGASGTAIASCAISARCANINYAGSALSLNGTTYHWRIKFWDSLDIEGAFSATNTFSTDAAPTAPTLLFSNDSNAQTGLTNPGGVLASHPVFSARFNDPDGADTATMYRIQVDNNNNFASPVWDSGASGTSMASCNQGVRCADVVFGGADLEANEAVYYWRIKFFDAAGVESPWSEDPIATTKFTMGLTGSSQQNATPQPQATIPETPIAGAVQVLGANSVRYNWIDTSSNETGFRILNADGNIVADVGPGVTSAEETNLPANAAVNGRSVLAYNNQGQSPTSPFSQAITAAAQSRPVLVRRSGDSVTFTIDPVLSGPNGGFPGQTAVKYELLVTNSQGETRTVSSEWIQQNEYTFQGISAEDRVEVRVMTRNQVALQNEPTVYENVSELSRRFAVSIGVFEKGTNARSNPINPNSVLSVSMRIESIGSDPASSVVLNLPLPRYVLYRVGTMNVDGRQSTDGFDGDAGQADQNGVSASWASMNPGESHSISFELAFDLADLQSLAQALAAANPLINLQASVSFAESDVVYMSPVITLEPDLALSEAPVVPETEPETPSEPAPEQPQDEVPAVVPTPEETNIIEQILEQEFGGTPTPTEPGAEPQPMLQTGETTTSSDAGTFNIDVSDGDSSLGLTGEAQVSGDAIRFTGTTTQPFTVITLIFNDSVTAIAVSDANGEWQTFVSADKLGIKPGEEAMVKIEAIAAKGDLRSERVSVGEVLVSRGRGGDIEAEFDTTVSDSAFVSVVEEIQHQVIKVIEKQEPAIQTTLSVAAPVVVVSSVPLWGYLPYAPTMIYHFITYVIGAIGRKKRFAARFYGVAYDSISKQPLALAIIRIYKVESALPQAASVGAAAASNKKLVTTVVTDKHGRYDALLEPGQYTLEVAKPGYLFPSQIVTTELDGNFQHVYSRHGMKVEGERITIPDLPLDPVNAQRQWQLATGPKKMWYALQKVGGYLAVPILLVGAILSALVVIVTPDKPINWIIAIFYIVLLSLQIKLRQKVERAWGVVYDIATNAVLPLTTIQLIEPASSKVVTSRLSDYQGRFAFLPEPGTYVVKASKAGYQQVAEVVEAPQTNRQPLSGEVSIEKPDQRISGDIAMRQGV